MERRGKSAPAKRGPKDREIERLLRRVQQILRRKRPTPALQNEVDTGPSEQDTVDMPQDIAPSRNGHNKRGS
jgi:hypothetical protein